MSLSPEVEAIVKELSKQLAKQKIEALSGACCVMFSAIFKVLLRSGNLTAEELGQTLNQIETGAANVKENAPELSAALTLMTLNLRTSLLPEDGSSN